MATALIIGAGDIAKRMKSRGGGGDSAAEEKESIDAPGAIDAKRMAAEDLVSALGMKPADVDMEEVVAALSDFHEACYTEENAKEEGSEKEAA